MNNNCTQGNPFEWATCRGTWGFDDDCAGESLSGWDDVVRLGRGDREATLRWFNKAKEDKAIVIVTTDWHEDDFMARVKQAHLSLVPPVDK